MNLYTDYAEEFSKTRQSPWPGWEKVINEVRSTKSEVNALIPNSQFLNLRVLDLGSGNGRFLKYLLDSDIQLGEYIGVDNSDILLNISRSEFKNVESRMKNEDSGPESSDQRLVSSVQFLKSDLNNIDHLRSLKLGKFDLVVAFGLIHHIETFGSRRRFFEETKFLLKSGGIFAIAFWNFPFMSRFKDRLEIFRNERVSELASSSVQKLNKEDLLTSDQRLASSDYSDQDYILPFGKNAKRFCHYCSTEEIQELEKGLDFKVLDEYYEDGKEGNQNLYKIYRKK